MLANRSASAGSCAPTHTKPKLFKYRKIATISHIAPAAQHRQAFTLNYCSSGLTFTAMRSSSTVTEEVVKPMKHLVLVFLTVFSVAPLLCAQESVTIKEPAERCYEDLKSNFPEAVRWNDEQRTVTSRPLVTTLSGSVQIITRIFTEFAQDKKTKEKVEICRLVVGIDAPDRAVAWNAMNSSALLRQASLMGARIDSVMKSRNKKGH